MQRVLIALLGAAAAMAVPAAAQAQGAGSLDDDVRCLALMALLASNADEATRSSGTMGTLYFLGKINGRNPGIDLQTALSEAAAELNGSQVNALAQRCGGEIKAEGQRLRTLGQSLKGNAP